jgi:sec-independent protein translocase protein TatC
MSATGTGTTDPVSGVGGPAAAGRLPEPVLDASGEMSFMDHLGVLRRHITRSMLWFGLAAIVAFVVVGPVWDLMMIPLCDAMPDRCYVYPRDLLESFWVYVKLGCLIAFFVAFPALFAEVWAFVAPGLYAHEKRIIIPFSLSAGVLFLGGACFGFFVIFPVSLKFLLSMEAGGTFVFLTSMQAYFSLCATLLIAAGIVFELPLLMMGLSLVGLVRPRWYRRYRRLMYIAMLIFSAVATPTTDPVTMVLMGGPMLLLYEVGILLSVLVWRKRDAATAAPAT